MIPNEVIDNIRSHDLVSILQREGLELRREGANYKCCCPFHNEKTPSFVVSPSRNLAHCFGENRSWDAIAFVMDRHSMTFYEAVEYLAAMLGIHYEKKELTPEEKEAQFKQEKIININRAAHKYFVEQLKRAPAARDYVKERGWNEQTVEVFGIGYAPASGGLYQYMKDNSWKDQDLFEAGLVNINDDGRYYDVFRERIIFPLYSNTGRLVGFNGRYIGDKADVAKSRKYINTKETAVYNKKKVLFGWYQAATQIRANETVILCEGNPDVMRLHQIGVQYAIAPCGTALTEDHIKFLKDKAKTVLLLGDMDDSGIAATIKHGIEFIKQHMAVRVMTWPYTPKMSPPDPKDPDEFFLRHPDGWTEALATNTSDFLPWYCHRLLEDKKSQSEIAVVITEIAGLLAYCDNTAVEMYLELFTKEYKNNKVWRTEYYKAKNALDRSEIDKDKSTQEMLKAYGFYIKNRCYYGAGASTNDRPWSNFIMEPVLHIRDERNARRIFRVINEAGVEEIVKFQQSELVSFTDFKRILESAGNYIWKVTAAELTQLKTYLYDDTPSADEIRQLGWQKRWGFFAWGNGGMDTSGKFMKADKYGVFVMNDHRFYLPGCAADTATNTQGYKIDRTFTYMETNDITLENYSKLLIQVFGDNAKVALGFLLATLFKDLITHITTSFPILNLFGPKGTGKSQLGHSLTSFFYTEYNAPNLAGSTKAALAEAVAEVSNAIVHLDEYKKDLPPEKQEILKGIWDGTGRTRINMDNDKRRETTAVDCGVIISGQEMPTADIALFSRMIFLTFSKTTFSSEEKQNFETLTRIEKRGLSHLTAQILAKRNLFSANYRTAWDDTISDLSSLVRTSAVEDRTLKNWATILAAIRVLDGQLGLPFNYPEMLKLCAKMCVEQNNKTRQSNEMAGFWETVENLVGSSRAWIEVDYRITPGGQKIETRESKKAGTKVELNPERRYLFINFNRLSSLYLKEGRDAQKVIPKDSLKYYLENSSEYIGTKLSMKFKLIDNQLGYTPSDLSQTKTRTTTAMVFDYDAIVDHYGISLEVLTGYHESEDSPEEKKDDTGDIPDGLF